MKIRKPVHIDRGVYSMEMPENGESAEITMYGEIVERRPVDWWTGEPVEGDYIIQSEFLKDLEAVSGAKSITLRLSSIGGDAGVSILIHNRLRDLAAKGASLTCIVDGAAMSGGSHIMCACDTVKVNPSSLIMIHKCWSTIFGGYNADELRELAASFDAWDKAQVSIYKRKTGLSETILSHMMSDTTYMTGTEAVEKGFADELLEDAEPTSVAASADGGTLYVNGRAIRLTPGMFAPDSIPTLPTEAQVPAKNISIGGRTMAKNLEELRQENPALAEALLAEAKAAVSAPPAPAAQADPIQAERKRLQEIDAVAALYDDETVREAKYGEHPCTAREMTYRAAQKAVQQGRKFLADAMADAKASGVDEIGAVPPPEDKGEKNSLEQARADAKAYNARKKEVR